MRKAKLQELLNALEAVITTVRADMEQPVDEIVVHIYHSRRAYDKACEKKGNKRLEEVMHTSLYRARELGYHGTAEGWREILRCWPPVK